MARSFSIPVTYQIHGQKPGRKASFAYQYAEMKEIEVEELGREQVDLAVSWTCSEVPLNWREALFFQTALTENDPSAHTLWYGQRHWTPLIRAASSRLSLDNSHITIDQLDEFIPNGLFNEAFGMERIARCASPYDVVTDDPSGDFERIKYPHLSTRAASKRSFDQLRLIAVDGLVYMACDQPCLGIRVGKPSISSRSDDPYVFLTTMRSVQRLRYGTDHLRFFPITMVNELRELYLGKSPYFPEMNIEIHLPESISCDVDHEIVADYFVADYIRPIDGKRDLDPELMHYFTLDSADEKLEFLSSTRDRWLAHARKKGLDTSSLDIAMTWLEDREIAPSSSILSSSSLRLGS